MQVVKFLLISFLVLDADVLTAQCVDGSYSLKTKNPIFTSTIDFHGCSRFKKTEVIAFGHGVDYSGGYYLVAGDTLTLIYDSIRTPYLPSSYEVTTKTSNGIDRNQVSINVSVQDQDKTNLSYAFFKLMGTDGNILYQDLADSLGKFQVYTNSDLVKGVDVGFLGHQPVFIDITQFRGSSLSVIVSLSAITNDKYFHKRKIETYRIVRHTGAKLVLSNLSNAEQNTWQKIEP